VSIPLGELILVNRKTTAGISFAGLLLLATLPLACTTGPSEGDARSQSAQKLQADGKWLEAVSEYNRVLKNDPNNTEILYNRGAAYSEIGQAEKAIEDLSEVIRRDP